jgi:HAD superfamily hydrolase (TIGR01509 family)
VIFDLDGVLWLSSPIHARAFAQAFAEIGIKLPKNAYASIAGLKTEAAIAQLVVHLKSSQLQNTQTLEHLALRKRELAAHWLGVENVLDPYAVQLLRTVRAAGYRTALATSASRSTVDLFLARMPAGEWFDVMVCGEDVTRAKPAPDIFLKAAAELSQNPTGCVVVEDSRAGVKAALAAGMFVIPYRIGLSERHALVIGRAEDLNQVQGILVGRAKNNCE